MIVVLLWKSLLFFFLVIYIILYFWCKKHSVFCSNLINSEVSPLFFWNYIFWFVKQYYKILIDMLTMKKVVVLKLILLMQICERFFQECYSYFFDAILYLNVIHFYNVMIICFFYLHCLLLHTYVNS